jgi:hypothetical protein
MRFAIIGRDGAGNRARACAGDGDDIQWVTAQSPPDKFDLVQFFLENLTCTPGDPLNMRALCSM